MNGPGVQRPKRLFVDMDGTLAVFRKVNRLETLYQRGYFSSLDPIHSVVDAIKTLSRQEPELKIHILSAYLSDSNYAYEEKYEWLDRYLPEIENRILLPCGEDKKDFVPGGLGKNDYLLDDYTQNLSLWEPEGQGIKLLNGINHTRGTWKGNCISFLREGKQIAGQIVEIINEGALVRDQLLFDSPVRKDCTLGY